MANGDADQDKAQAIRHYKAVIVTNNEWPPDETNVALLRMEVDFTIGNNNKSDPERTIIGMIEDLHIQRWVQVESVTEVEPA